MGRHDRKHSSDAKAAVAHAMNVQGMTAEQVVALAGKGQLKAPGRRDRCRPFEIAESTVKEYARLARRRERRNGHENDVPEVALAVRDAKPRPGQPLGELTIDNGESSLTRLVNEANDYLAAVEQGLRCECPEPDLASYGWEGHGRQCHNCNRPTQEAPDSPRGAPPPP